jgi:hypothetical protein
MAIIYSVSERARFPVEAMVDSIKGYVKSEAGINL